MQGKVIESREVVYFLGEEQKNIVFDLSLYKSGVYLYQIYSGNNHRYSLEG